jgi:hypothetical protein
MLLEMDRLGLLRHEPAARDASVPGGVNKEALQSTVQKLRR